MKVPLLDLRAQNESLRAELLPAIKRVFDSQQFILGPEVRSLEEELAEYSQTQRAIACASGTDALLLALMALDIKSGDEVITTPFTFFATGSAIARVGALPIFVDIDPRTYNLEVAHVEEAITPQTRAIMPVHLYGQCAEMDPLLEIGERHQLPIIEDAAQAVGSEDRGRRAGSMGRMGCFSFYPTKNLGGAGDGGMITTNDWGLATRLKQLRVHGALDEYHHSEIGINSRLDTLQAAILRVKLKYLDSWSKKRQMKAATYNRMFRESDLGFELVPPLVRPNTRHIFHQYVVRVPGNRDLLIKHLAANGVGTKIYYPIPLHLQKCFEYLGYKEGAFPEAERAARETVALPCYPELTEVQQQYVVDAIRGFQP